MSDLDEKVAEQDFERKVAHKWLAHLGYSPEEIVEGEAPTDHSNCQMEDNFYNCFDGETDKSNHPLQDEIGKEISTVMEILDLSGIESYRLALQDALAIPAWKPYVDASETACGFANKMRNHFRQVISNRLEGE
jgi:hypothetical protein